MSIRFYCGIAERKWNHHPTVPGPYACIAPVCGRSQETHQENRVTVPEDTLVIQDSGAFSDAAGRRLSLEEALTRQVDHAQKHVYAQQITHRASYDLLIDEKWQDGMRTKQRWSEAEGEFAVRQTVAAAEYLVAHRSGLGLVLSAQGVTPQQYLRCTAAILPLLGKGDILGLGGWCILGMRKSLLPIFFQTLSLVMPAAAHAGVRDVHVWGSCFAEALAELLWWGNYYGISISTDSASPSTRPAFGRYGYAEWVERDYELPMVHDTCRLGQFDQCVRCRGLERSRHVEAVRSWLERFDETVWYRSACARHTDAQAV